MKRNDKTPLRQAGKLIGIVAAFILAFAYIRWGQRTHNVSRQANQTSRSEPSTINHEPSTINHPGFPPLRFATQQHLFVTPTRSRVLTAVRLLPAPARYTAMPLNPRTNRLYLGNYKQIAVIDADSDRLIKTIDLPHIFDALAVNPVTNRLYVTHRDHDMLVIDGTSHRLMKPLPYQTFSPVFVDPAANRLYVQAREKGEELTEVLDGNTHALLASIKAEFGGLAVNPNTRLLYITQPTTRKLLVVDTETHRIQKTLSFPPPRLRGADGPHNVAVNPETNRVYVPHANLDDQMSVIDGRIHTRLQTVPFGYMPHYVAVNPRTNRLFVTDPRGFRLYVIDTETHRTVTSHKFDDAPDMVTVNPETSKLYVRLGSGVVVVFKEAPRH